MARSVFVRLTMKAPMPPSLETALTRLLWMRRELLRFARNDGWDSQAYLPVFTMVHSRLMTRWVAGSRAVMTNSFLMVASSG
jgi:hypothetical protein